MTRIAYGSQKEIQLSIVVLTYNRSTHLARCLRSLLKQKCDSLLNFEIVVCDDGSTDDTRFVVLDFAARYPNIVYAHQIHRGIPAARNLGLSTARAPLIAILADDYILRGDYIQTVISFFNSNPEAMVVRFKVVGDCRSFGSRLSHYYYDISYRKRLTSTPFNKRYLFFKKLPNEKEGITTDHSLEPSGGAAFRRQVFSTVGTFNERLPRGEDSELGRRLKQAGIPIHYNPFHQIVHYNERIPFDTLRKCYLTGFYRPDLHGKGQRSPFRRCLMQVFNGFLLISLRVRNVDSVTDFILFPPFLVLFELADRLGYITNIYRRSRRSRQKIVRPPG